MTENTKSAARIAWDNLVAPNAKPGDPIPHPLSSTFYTTYRGAEGPVLPLFHTLAGPVLPLFHTLAGPHDRLIDGLLQARRGALRLVSLIDEHGVVDDELLPGIDWVEQGEGDTDEQRRLDCARRIMAQVDALCRFAVAHRISMYRLDARDIVKVRTQAIDNPMAKIDKPVVALILSGDITTEDIDNIDVV